MTRESRPRSTGRRLLSSQNHAWKSPQLRSRGPGTASPGSAVTNQQGRLSLQEGPCQPLPLGRTAGGWAAESEALEEHAGHRGDSSGWPGAEVPAPTLTSGIREAVTLDPDKQPGAPSVPRSTAASFLWSEGSRDVRSSEDRHPLGFHVPRPSSDHAVESAMPPASTGGPTHSLPLGARLGHSLAFQSWLWYPGCWLGGTPHPPTSPPGP